MILTLIYSNMEVEVTAVEEGSHVTWSGSHFLSISYSKKV